MISSRFRTSRALTFVSLIAAVACGSLEEGEIIIVDGNTGGSSGSGGDSGGGSGGASGSGSGGDSGGGSGGTSGSGGTAGTGGTVNMGDGPTVTSVSPASGSTAAEPNTLIELEFSEPVDGATVTPESFRVSDGPRVVPGTLAVNGAKVVFTPESRLDLLATYEVTVAPSVADADGDTMGEEFKSTFTVRDGAWGEVVTLSNAEGRVDTGRYPDPMADGQGRMLFAWAQYKPGETFWSIWVRQYVPGTGWSEAKEIDGVDVNAVLPSIAVNRGGDAVVAWLQDDEVGAETHRRVYARRLLAGEWEAAPQRVDEFTDSTSIEDVFTVATALGDFHVVWRAEVTYQNIYAVQANGAGAWEAPGGTYIAGFESAMTGPALAFDPLGNGFMAYSSGSPAQIRVKRYLRSTGRWENSSSVIPGSAGVASSSYPSSAIHVAVDPQGGALVIWRGTNGVSSSRFTRAAGWAEAVPVETSAGEVLDWTPLVDWNGSGFSAFWAQSAATMNAYASHSDGTSWETPALVSDGDRNVFEWSDLGFGTDRHGNALATWSQGADLGTEVYAARYVRATNAWAPARPFEFVRNSNMEVHLGVAANGVGLATWAVGYPYYQTHEALYGAAFE